MEVLLLFSASLIVWLFIMAGLHKLGESGYKKAESEWEEDEQRYEAIIRKLPADTVKEMLNLLAQAHERIKRVTPDSLPDEFMKIIKATLDVNQKGTYGNVTGEQRQKINMVVEELRWVVTDYIPAANMALCELADTDGLGFGIITNSAASAVAYSVLDDYDKLKGNERRIREHYQAIDKQLVSIMEKLRQITY